MAFRRILKSLPEPFGWVPETNLLATNAYSPSGYRSYDAHGQYIEIVEFFKQEFPHASWYLIKEKEDPFDPQRNDYVQSTSMIFSYQDRYCLDVIVGTSVAEDGTQQENRVWVHMSIIEEPVCDFW
jgi:hypothetical protein